MYEPSNGGIFWYPWTATHQHSFPSDMFTRAMSDPIAFSDNALWYPWTATHQHSFPSDMFTGAMSDPIAFSDNAKRKASAIARRKLKKEKKLEECSITNAVSGNLITKFREFLPYCFNPQDFKQEPRLQVSRIINPDGTATNMTAFTFTRERKDVSVVLGAILPRNIHGDFQYYQPGWRRWHKEFCVYARKAFPIDTFKATPLRTLVPLIMQARVEDARQTFTREDETLPQHGREWEGVYHSIVIRTQKRATLQEARIFVADWLAKNQGVLGFVFRTVRADPFRQYFE